MTTEPLRPVSLRCAHKVSPLAVEADRVRLSWSLEGAGVGRYQRAYQVVVHDLDAHAGGAYVTAWDSGQVSSSVSTDLPYLGEPLLAGHRYSWLVRVWDEGDASGPWSEPAFLEVALDGKTGWRAKWILLRQAPSSFGVPSGDGPIDPVTAAMAPVPYFRRTFEVKGQVLRARLHVTALGIYEVHMNGRRVSDDVLSPGWTDYKRRVLYQTYDVTQLLVPGENVLGAIVADGWACGFFGFDPKRRGAHYARSPQLLAQLVLRMADGSGQEVVTDQEWRGSTGSVAYADLLMGERREPTREPLGWDRPGYDASAWLPVACRPLEGPALIADPGPPIRVTEDLPAREVAESPSGAVRVDFGQNLAGWVRVKTRGRAGPLVEVRHAEMLDSDGSLYLDNLRTARQRDTYLVTDDEQDLSPRFTFHGFRYAEISGLAAGNVAQVCAQAVHSDIPPTGKFECSSKDINQLYSNIDWGQRGNFISIPTDCPQRDERLGWLGDAQIFVRTAAYNRDVAAFFSKWLDDVADAQLPSGAFADFAPRLNEWRGSPAWADAGVIVPWTMYKMYGDTAVLERQFPSMVAWMDYLAANNPGKLWAVDLGNDYGDWLAPKGDRTPRPLLATAYWAYDASLMAEVAQAIGRPDKAEEYLVLQGEITEAFRRAYLHPDGTVVSGTQTAYVLALHMGLVPPDMRRTTTEHLVHAIEDEDWHLTTGFVGVGYILPVLSSNGYTAAAYRLLEQRTYPSWLYSVDRGATTIWERWDGWTEDRGFQSPKMNSFNHYSLGSAGEWLYRFVLGIELAPGASGFDRLALRPHPGGSLTFARGSYRSVRGEIRSDWSLGDGVLRWDVELPPNIAASVHVPSSRPDEVVASGRAVRAGTGDYPGQVGQREAVFQVGSGAYSFSGPSLDAGPMLATDSAQAVRSAR